MRALAHTLQAAGVTLVQASGNLHRIEAVKPFGWQMEASDWLHDVELELERALKATREVREKFLPSPETRKRSAA